MESPVVSILTPTHNHEDFLEACIKSVLAQTYLRWELLILDDGSTDATGTIAERYAACDARVRYLPQESNGIWKLAETYNRGLATAQGEYIAVLEGDDMWPTDKLMQQVAWHQSIPNLVFSHGAAEMVGARTGPLSIPPQFVDTLSTDVVLGGILSRDLFVTAATMMINRIILEGIGGFQTVPGFPAVDLPTWIRLCQEPGLVKGSNSILGSWRVHSSQISQNYGVEMAVGGMEIRIAGVRRTQVPGITEEAIRVAHRPVIIGAYMERLRHALRKARRSEARRATGYILRHGSWLDKLRALRAWVR